MSEEALEFLGQSGFIRIEDKAQLLDVYFLLKVFVKISSRASVHLPAA
jgi:hypothetical protein